ncbi:MAG: DUF4386 domain-containing protein [Bacteroidetes bacterium]|nr:DUF4386 domain-containing protein [Bacteroidota bacterium]
MSINIKSQKKLARLAGGLFFIWILTGIYGIFYIPSQITMTGEAKTVAQNILSNEFLFRTGIINNLISSLIWIIMVLIFYRLFKSVNERHAKLLVAFVIVQIPVVIISEAFNITSLMLFKGEILKAFELSQRQELAVLFLNINDYVVSALILYWGLWLLPLGSLVYKSGFILEYGF